MTLVLSAGTARSELGYCSLEHVDLDFDPNLGRCGCQYGRCLQQGRVQVIWRYLANDSNQYRLCSLSGQ